jgi:hypothetical protein
MPNYYRSEARILPVEAKGTGGGLGNLASAAAAFGVNLPSSDSGETNFTDILASRTIREQLLNKEFTFKVRRHRLGSETVYKGSLMNFLGAEQVDQGMRSLKSIITITRDLKSRVITIEVETISPELSQQIVRQLVWLLEQFAQDRGRTRGGAKAIYAGARLEEAQKELLESESALRRFLDNNHNYQGSQDPAVRLTGMRLDADFRLRQQLLTTLALSREQALMEEKNDMPILNILDAGNYPYEKSKPSRSEIILLTTGVVMVMSWIWLNREKVKGLLFLGAGK